MDLDLFHAAVCRVRAEQYFAEKTASAAVDPVALAGLARAGDVEDPELLKVAAMYCPEAPLEFYEKRLGGKFKTAALNYRSLGTTDREIDPSDHELLLQRQAKHLPGAIGAMVGGAVSAPLAARLAESVQMRGGSALKGGLAAGATALGGLSLGHLLGRQFNNEAAIADIDRQLIAREVGRRLQPQQPAEPPTGA